MSQTAVAEAREAPSQTGLAFDRLYRSSRDDVYAYVASLLHDGPATEEVTATAFERAYRKRSRFDPSRGEPRLPRPPARTRRDVRSHGADRHRRGRRGDSRGQELGLRLRLGVGDALHDAGHILAIAAGVVLIGLAVLAPIALIALLIWTANRIRVRRPRERTLG